MKTIKCHEQREIDCEDIYDSEHQLPIVNDIDVTPISGLGGSKPKEVLLCKINNDPEHMVLKRGFGNKESTLGEVKGMTLGASFSSQLVIIPRPIYLYKGVNGIDGYFSLYQGFTERIDDKSWMRLLPSRRKSIKYALNRTIRNLSTLGVQIDGFDNGIRRNASLLYTEEGPIIILFDLYYLSPGKCDNSLVLQSLDFWLPS